MSPTFYWHDYETWGADPRRDRACQFAGLRTDTDLNEVGDPLVLFCRPATDLLPQPEACLITGITPQLAEREGLVEAEFAARIHAALSEPGTCGVGYNSLRFDDEVTRHLLYRNLYDPYAREWRNGNSRWDLIDTLRLAHALRPDGLEWPTHEDGTVSFKLEQLTAANAIGHAQAHDALADVRATLALARRLRQAQPRLFDYTLTLRDKRRGRDLLAKGEPLLHVSARYPAALGCLAPVFPVAQHPTNGNGVICFDLRADPAQLLDLSVEELRARLFTPSAHLPEGVERVPLKTVHVNRAPVLATLKTLTAQTAERWRIDPDQVVERARWIAASAADIQRRVQAAHQLPEGPAETDPDLMLYSGGFFSDQDRRILDGMHRLSPAELAQASPVFEDARLPRMLFRYRARNWPESLTPEEREDWDAERLTRLTDPDGGGSIQIDPYEQRLMELAEIHAADPGKLQILEALSGWAEQVLDAAI
ncbi:exodeoxyribonuclease I [Thiocystis violascens]|uniref:Exodeoxyribonuclease I n=1 Tax=Thiocystis violascens (strain ATCC 17096 / DSM 198 / 6111) TaxID=765911 RepID=I3YGL4_THIV6|nr:exodeoxyribonuclease I [Thiocystis violascens]AFL76132.1 exonuclease I [Thiocystis violascens DSM 198]